MPELPEVTVIVNSLNKKINGLEISGIEYDWSKGFHWNGFSAADLKGQKVEKVERVGKIVIIKMSKGLAILIHLKLTGQLIYQDVKTRIAGGHPIPPLNLPVPNKTTRVTFSFTNGGYLYFNDIRKFGWVRVVESEKLKEQSYLEKLGPDALEITLQDFIERIKKKPNARIKKLLMDQSFISGVGNIYSDEGLWRAKIHPKRLVASLNDAEIKTIFEGIRDAMKLAISKGGASANSFVDSSGEKGLYLSFARAYHMTGRPCQRCRTPIAREKMDGRSAHFCPSCQTLR